jgi:hypothetical protein
MSQLPDVLGRLIGKSSRLVMPGNLDATLTYTWLRMSA